MNPVVARRVRAFVALGANIGEPVRHLRAAVDDMAALPGTAVVALDTNLEPLALLRALLAIEARHGRLRSVPNAPRTLDLDLLLHGEQQQDEPELTLPHPRMHERAFVLLPLLEIVPDVRIPGLGAACDFLPGVSNQAIARSESM